MSEALNVHAAAEAHYCSRPRPIFHSSWDGPMVPAAELIDAFKAGAAWQMGHVVADVAGDRDVKEQLQPNEGGYRLRLNGDGPHELHHFGNPEALKALREVFANGTTLDSKDAAAIPRRVPRMPSPHDELMANFGRADKDRERNYADVMAKLEAINKAVVGGVTALVQDAQFELRHLIVDVGQKVEAVLDQVTPRDNGPYNATGLTDTAESEADHWRRRAVELDLQREHLKLERDDWHHAYDKLVSDVVHGRSPLLKEHSAAATINPPAWAGAINDIIVFDGSLIVACQNGIFRLHGHDLIPMQFAKE